MLVTDKNNQETLNRGLHALFTSRVRMKILSIFVPSPSEKYYVRQVTRMTNEEVNAVRRELERLKAIGLLKTEERGNRLYYRVSKNFPFYYELLRMVGKTTGLGQELIERSESLGKIKYATLSLRFLQKQPPSSSDIDILFVGKIELEVLQDIVRRYEESLGHEINYTVLNAEEFDYRKSRGDAFIRSVLSQPQVVVIGSEEEMYG